MKLISTIAVMIFLTGMASAAPNLEATGAVAKTPHSLFMLRVAEGEPLDGMMHAPLVRVRSISDGMFDGMMAAERIGTGGQCRWRFTRRCIYWTDWHWDRLLDHRPG